IDGLLKARGEAFRRTIHHEALGELRGEVATSHPVKKVGRETINREKVEGPQLYVLARTMEQLEAVLAWEPVDDLARPAMVYCDFVDVRRYREAVTRARAAAMPIGLATMRIIKPGEEGLLRQVAKCEPDAVLIRHLAALCHFREPCEAPSAQTKM